MLWEWEEQTDLTAFKTLLRYKKAFIKTSEYVKHCEGTKQGCKGKAVPQLCAASTVSPSENTYTYPCPERADQPPQPSKQKQKDHMDSRAVAERKTNSTPQKHSFMLSVNGSIPCTAGRRSPPPTPCRWFRQ